MSKHRCPAIKPVKKEVNLKQAEPETRPETNTDPTEEDEFDDSDKTPYKYNCNVCNEDFTSLKKYKVHIKGHERVALRNKTDTGYLCSFCGMNLTRADSLISHIRTHTGEKPYKCDICGRFFRQRCSLRNHKQLHTGKQTMCELCPKTFASRAFLRLHMRSHNSKYFFNLNLHFNKQFF